MYKSKIESRLHCIDMNADHLIKIIPAAVERTPRVLFCLLRVLIVAPWAQIAPTATRNRTWSQTECDNKEGEKYTLCHPTNQPTINSLHLSHTLNPNPFFHGETSIRPSPLNFLTLIRLYKPFHKIKELSPCYKLKFYNPNLMV